MTLRHEQPIAITVHDESRPPIGAKGTWDIAREDMIKHDSHWARDTWPHSTPHRIRGGQLQVFSKHGNYWSKAYGDLLSPEITHADWTRLA